MKKIIDYGFVKIASATPKLKVADVSFNTNEIIKVAKEATDEKASIIVFPELSLTGYTCADLFLQSKLWQSSKSAILKITEFSEKNNICIIVGAPIRSNGRLFNCAVVINQGNIEGIVPKTFLCNTNEYYEERWFSSANDRVEDLVMIDGKPIPFGEDLIFGDINSDLIFGIEICEDLWSVTPPGNDMALAGANVIFNQSASNEYLGKVNYRNNLVAMQSARLLSAYVYSACGANESTTDTVFSGHSMIYESGIKLTEMDRFSFDNEIIYADIDIDKLNNDRINNNSFSGSKPRKEFRQVELEIKHTSDSLEREYSPTPFIPVGEKNREEVCEEILNIQLTGLAKRLLHIGCKNVTIGISGGLDSTLALLVTYKAFQKINLPLEGIKAISMPGFGTSARTKNNAVELINKLGVSYEEIDIKASVNQHFQDIKHKENDFNIVYENAQARERTKILMDLANKFNGIVVGTGDLSELALGWCTYNADQMSMYNVNSGVPKTLVRYLIQYFAEKESEKSLKNVLFDIIDTPISPELLPTDTKGNISQKTEDKIGSYKINDFILYHTIRSKFAPEKIFYLAKKTFKGEYDNDELKNRIIEFYKRFFSQQFKRSAMPDGPKIGTVSLSPRADWRMPSDANYETWVEKLKNIH